MNKVIYQLDETVEFNQRVEGRASAEVAIKANTGFVADTLYINENNDRPIFVLATQAEGLEGELSALGTAIRLFYDQEGKPSVQSIFAVVDSGTFLAHRIGKRDVLWDPANRQLAIHFEFEFRFGGEEYQMTKGCVELKV